MTRYLKMLALTLALFLSVIAIGPSTVIAKGNSKGGSKSSKEAKQFLQAALRDAQSRVSAAQQALAVATQKGQRAQSVLSGLQPQYESTVHTVGQSKLTADYASGSLQSIEKILLDAIDDDSPLGRAQSAYEQANRQFQAATDRILGSAAYKAKYREAAVSIRKVTLLPKLRTESLEADQEWRKAKNDLEYTQKTYERLRIAYLQEDADWVAATKETTEAKAQEIKARQGLSNVSLKVASARGVLRDAIKTAAVARSSIATGQATVKKLQASLKKVQSSQRRGSHSRSRR